MICLPSLEFSSIWGSPSIIMTYSGPIFSAKSSACLMSASSVLVSLFLLRLSYLLIELYYIAILLKFRFIAADDLDDFLNLRQCWLRGVWRRFALLRLSKRWHHAAKAEMARTSFSFMIGFPDYAQALLVMASYGTLPAGQ